MAFGSQFAASGYSTQSTEKFMVFQDQSKSAPNFLAITDSRILNFPRAHITLVQRVTLYPSPETAPASRCVTTETMSLINVLLDFTGTEIDVTGLKLQIAIQMPLPVLQNLRLKRKSQLVLL